MTKKFLLAMINNSILKFSESKRELYIKYYPLIENAVSTFPDKAKLRLSALDEFKDKYRFDNFIRENDKTVIEKKLKTILEQLRIGALCHSEKGKVPNGTEQANLRADIVSRIDGLISRLNAFVDNSENKASVSLLEDSRKILDDMFIPKNDTRVLTYYLEIMELIDNTEQMNFDSINEDLNGTVKKIALAVANWKNLNRV